MKQVKIILSFLLITFLSCNLKSEKKEYAEMIIEKVENFKTQNNRLPNNVSEIGLIEMEDSPAFYQTTSDSTYQVWYGISLGESNTYNSETQKWKKGG